MLKEQIQNDIITALKKGHKEIAEVLRLVLAALTLKEKEKRYKVSKEKPEASEQKLIKESELTDDQIIDTLSGEVKKRKDATELYEKGNRKDLADKEKKEIELLQKYLPSQLSQEELRELVRESIKNFYNKEINLVKSVQDSIHPETKQFNRVKDIGKIMADLMPKIKGRTDNSEVSKIVKELLNLKGMEN